MVLGASSALAPAQSRSYDVLAHARKNAKAQNQRVLLHLTGGDAKVGVALIKSLADYRTLGKLVRYEYQVAALPGTSTPAAALCKRLRLVEGDLPVLVVLDSGERVLDTLKAEDMVADGTFVLERVRSFLEKHMCAHLHARTVLADGLAVAKKTKRSVFVYLSAPW